ncbi:MAG: ABC transporter [Acidobacteria bacterium]|nr:MAG: ABC transporter [Acidobacteriota bacterium]PIE90952.1 MAG: ABC transporter [Acidobacteriota bacterium]
MTISPTIELQNLSVHLAGRPILKNLNASLNGRAIGLLGPNGSGKTTLIHSLLGFFKPFSGTAKLLGHDLSEGKTIRQILGYMPERDAFIAGMSGIHFVRYMAELSGLAPGLALEKAHEAMYYVGLGEARYRKIETYSLGMKQLIKLAQALVHGPELIFLDEPTNGLDPPARTRMLDLIREISSKGEAKIILSSHLLKDVEDCCSEVLILKSGEIAVYCDLEKERKENRKFIECAYSGSKEDFVRVLQNKGCETAVPRKKHLKIVLHEQMEVTDIFRLAAETNVQIRKLSFKRDSLEDIFLKAMEGSYVRV